ncbi:MAG: GFA family protein [Acinetobacter sp.]|nr:GFA family protein [Acinetobacter sp.]
MYSGSCLCGGVAFEIEDELEPIQMCHCSQCRKAQGTPFVTNTPVAATALRFVQGGELLSSFESSPGKRRVFCKVCGSPIYSQHVNVPSVFRIRAGLIDGDLNTSPAFHIYYDSKANWFEANDDLPKFAGARVEPAT